MHGSFPRLFSILMVLSFVATTARAQDGLSVWEERARSSLAVDERPVDDLRSLYQDVNGDQTVSMLDLDALEEMVHHARLGETPPPAAGSPGRVDSRGSEPITDQDRAALDRIAGSMSPGPGIQGPPSPDVNGDGQVTPADLRLLERLRELFRDLDLDNDGFLSVPELGR